jgi:hypothetical protein
MAIPRRVDAQLLERFIFNFRFPPDAFASHLPVPWLRPQEFNGWSIVSFCILKLDNVIIWPLPGFLGKRTISCAYRGGVTDLSRGREEPSVYITDRNSDLPLIARLAPWLFADTIPMMRPSIVGEDGKARLQINYADGQRLFYAETQPALDWSSEAFETIDDFARFISLGISSYTPSIYGDCLARVDLKKDESAFKPLDATVDFSWLDGAWLDSSIEFDSAARATGGEYKWTYRGLRQI